MTPKEADSFFFFIILVLLYPMVTDSSVYLAFFGCRLTQIVIMVMAPSLPVNIKEIKIHRAAMPSPGVMPVANPAVLKLSLIHI